MIGCTFIDKSNTLLVGFDLGVIFTINLDLIEEGWKVYEGKIRAEWYEFLFVDGVRMNPFNVSLVEKGMSHDFWLAPPPKNLRDDLDYHITLVEYAQNQKCVPCIVSAGIDEETGNPFIICDLFEVDLSQNKMQKPPARLHRFKYVVTEKSDLFCTLGIFPLIFHYDHL